MHWFDEFPHHRFLHPFKDTWPVWQYFKAYRNGRFPKIDIIDRDDEIIICSESRLANKNHPARTES